MSKRESLETIFSRNRAFVRREEADRPLVGVGILPTMALQRWKRIVGALPANGPVYPGMIRTEDFLKDVEDLVMQHEEIGGDIIWAPTPPIEMNWAEGIIGCSLRIFSHSIWATPSPNHWDRMREIDLSTRNEWWQKLVELQTALVDYARGRYPVASSTSMRGPGDMLVATLGVERLCLELYDNLGKVKNLASIYTKLWAKAVNAQHELVPGFHGGHLPAMYCIWTPGMAQFVVEDSLSFFSPKFYRAVLIDEHRTMCATAEYSLFHLHPAGLYALEDLVTIEGLKVIEVNREVTGPTIVELLPSLRKIQEHTALVIAWSPGAPGKVALEAEIRYIVEHLTPRGLCLHFSAKDVEEGKSLINLVREVFREKRRWGT